MNELEQKALIEEVEQVALSVYAEEKLDFNPDIKINGVSYYYPASQQLADHICKKEYKEFRLSCEKQGTSAKVYLERVLQEGGFFYSTKYAPKQCIGVLLCDIEKNQIILRKTSVDTEVHEFHADSKRNMNDCFGVQYELFKYLRDNDLIQIHAIERKVRHKEKFIYTISKLKAVRNGRFLHFHGYGIQFFIPKADFKCVNLGRVKETKKNKTKTTNNKTK